MPRSWVKRLEHFPYKNRWWRVLFCVDPRGLVARHMFSGDLSFEISFDLVAHELEVVTGAGEKMSFAFRDGLFVAGFHGKLFSTFETLSTEIAPN